MLPLRVYLDWNVIIDLDEGSFPPDTVERLERLRQQDLLAVPYSSAHVEEARRLERVSRDLAAAQRTCTRQLALLHRISGGIYLRHEATPDGSPGGLLIQGTRDPALFDMTTAAWPAGARLVDAAITIFPDTLVELFREICGLDPRELNNVQPECIFPVLWQKWSDAQSPDRQAELERRIRQEHPGLHWAVALARGGRPFGDPPQPLEQTLAIAFKGKDLLTPQSFCVLFTLLDFAGYHPDRRRRDRHSGIGRFWDGQHAYFGSQTGFLVSGDRRFRMRSAAIIHWLQTGAQVVASSDLPLLLDEMDARRERGHRRANTE